MPSMKASIRDVAVRECWFKYHHHYSTSAHDYIAGRGLGFCKPLGGEATRTPNPFPFDSPCHVTGSLVPLVPFICSLSSSQSSESK